MSINAGILTFLNLKQVTHTRTAVGVVQVELSLMSTTWSFSVIITQL